MMSFLFRHIMKRMLLNFTILFVLFYVLGAVIDIIVNLDEFDKAARLLAEDEGVIGRVSSMLSVAFKFEGPRFFQVYAYLHGVIAIGAMAFTASTMWKSREFVAMMAAGISLRLVAAPFILVSVLVSLVALANQEYIHPEVAPALLREHHESSKDSASSFAIPFTPDKNGTLLIAPSFHPAEGALNKPTFLIRDARGRMVRQVKAENALWDDQSNSGWQLHNGKAIDIQFDEDTEYAEISSPEPIEFYETDLSPHILTLHRYGQFVSMLSMSQLNSMLDSAGTFDKPLLKRHWYARFATIILNAMAMIIVIPLFVTRDEIALSKQAVYCGGISIIILFGGVVFMLMPVGGLPSMVSVFLPAIVLLPVGLIRLVTIRT